MSKSHKLSNEIILFIASNFASGRGNPVLTNFNKRLKLPGAAGP